MIGIDLEKIISELDLQAVRLDEELRIELVARLQENLGVDLNRSFPWDDPRPVGLQRSDGWALVPTFSRDAPCVMFLDRAAEMWLFRSGTDLLLLLNESPAMEFYLCDVKATYLLCHNHHDFIVGWGSAKRWVESLS